MSAAGSDDLFGHLPVGRPEARAKSAARYWRPSGACPRCGGRLYRTRQAECQRCRQVARPVREQMRLAIRRAIRGIPLTGQQRMMLAATSAGVWQWVLDQCARLSLSPLAYGRQWEVWHRRPLCEFDLKTRAGFLAANCLPNLEVRPVRGGRGKEVLP